MRNINRPVADASGITKIVPVELGGFGSTNADEAAANIAAASSSLLGLPNGLAQLDEDGKISLENFPSPTMFAPTLKGPTKVNPGERVIYEITNWEPGKSYTVSATAGSVSIAGNQVAFIAPKDFGIVGLSVGDRTVNVEVTSIVSERPQIYVTDNPDSALVSVRLSDFKEVNGLKLGFSQIELRNGEESEVIVLDQGDKISTTLTDLKRDSRYSVKGRHISENGIVSEWSQEVFFLTGSEQEKILRQILIVSENIWDFSDIDDDTIIASHPKGFYLFKKKDGIYTQKNFVNDYPGTFQGTCIMEKNRFLIHYYAVSYTSGLFRIYEIDTGVFLDRYVTVDAGYANSSDLFITYLCCSLNSDFIYIDPYASNRRSHIFKINPVDKSIIVVNNLDHSDSLTSWGGYSSAFSPNGTYFVKAGWSGNTKRMEIHKYSTVNSRYELQKTISNSDFNVLRGCVITDQGEIMMAGVRGSYVSATYTLSIYRIVESPTFDVVLVKTKVFTEYQTTPSDAFSLCVDHKRRMLYLNIRLVGTATEVSEVSMDGDLEVLDKKLIPTFTVSYRRSPARYINSEKELIFPKSVSGKNSLYFLY